jgi:hypothetical protein
MDPHPDPQPDAQIEPKAETDDQGDLLDDAVAEDAQQRLWLRSIIPLLQIRSHDSAPSSRVQFAFDQMFVAACERVARILGSDLSA